MCEKRKEIEDGSHYGEIVDIQYTNNKYQYTQLVIEHKESGIKLKAGYPTKVMLDSKLGKLLQRFGIKVEENKNVDPDQLKGRKCVFTTIKSGNFSNVVEESVKPAVRDEKPSGNPVD